MGEEFPWPGGSIFQSTFSVSDQVCGYLPGPASPCPEGPRQRGQYLTPSPSGKTMRTSAAFGSPAWRGRNKSRTSGETTTRRGIDSSLREKVELDVTLESQG